MRRGDNIGDEDLDLPILKSFDQKTIFAQDNCFYSTYEPDELISVIMSKLSDRDIKHNKVDKKFKIVYEEYEEQSEQEKADELPQKGVRVQIKITEVDVDSRVCVEFNKIQGDYFLFRKSLNHMRDLLADFNDVVIDQELLKDVPAEDVEMIDGQIQQQ